MKQKLVAKIVAALCGDPSCNWNDSSDMAQLPLPKTARPLAWLPESSTDGPLCVTFTNGVARQGTHEHVAR